MNGFLHWLRTSTWAYVAMVLVVVALIIAVNPGNAFGQSEPRDDFVNGVTTRYSNGSMGHTDRGPLNQLLGSNADPTHFGKVVRSAYREKYNNHFAKGLDWPDPEDYIGFVKDSVSCGTWLHKSSGWVDVACATDRVSDKVNAAFQDTTKAVVNCGIASIAGTVAVKTVIRDPGGSIRVILKKNGYALATGIAFCTANHWFDFIPQL